MQEGRVQQRQGQCDEVVKPWSSSCRGVGDESIINVSFNACRGGPKHDTQRHRPMHCPQHGSSCFAAAQKGDNHQIDGIADTHEMVTHGQHHG
jgi:hypothetical protein